MQTVHRGESPGGRGYTRTVYARPAEPTGAVVAEHWLLHFKAGLDSVEPRERGEGWSKLKARLDLAQGAGDVDEGALEARIATDPKDFEARFALATLQARRGAWRDAFAQLLEVVLRDRAEARKAARDKLVEWFPLCPDPKAVMNARRELSMYLN